MLKSSPTRLIIDPAEHKHLLIQSINNLSNRIQQTKVEIEDAGKGGNYVILKLENEALDHIEQTILGIFNAILTASGDDDQATPEQTLTMSYAVSASSCADTPVTNLSEAEFKTRQVLPRNYAEGACPKALFLVDKCRAILNSTKRIFMLKNKTIVADELDHLFTFPVERINQLLTRAYGLKFDLYVTIYLVAILEYIAKDMLHLATRYASYLNKYSISKEDVCTAIHADYVLNKLLVMCANGSVNKAYSDMFDDCENDDDDDDGDSRYGVGGGSLNNSTMNLQAVNMGNNSQVDDYNLGKVFEFLDYMVIQKL
jgi:hypothetical protein